MTYVYEWFGLPNEVNIICPSCKREAYFEFAIVTYIQGKRFQAFYTDHQAFETTYIYDSNSFTYKFCSIFYPALHVNPSKYLEEIPKEHNDVSQKVNYLNNGRGTVTCHHCLIKRKHELQWPLEAYYRIEYKTQVLWAPNREVFQSIHDYIESKDRERSKYGNYVNLLHIPHHFLTQNARKTVVKKIKTFLLTH